MSIFSHIIQRKYAIALALLILLGFLLIARVALLRHWAVKSYHFDLGNMHQAVYNTSQGHFLEVTDPNRFHQSNRLAYHFDPILALIAPLYWIYPGAETLIVVQALILVLGVIPLYLLAINVLKNKLYGLAFAAMYLMFYPMNYTAIADFHAVTLSTTFVLWMFYCAEIRKFGWSGLFMLLLWMTKENTALLTIFFGLYHVVYKKNRTFGVVTAMASVVLFFLMIRVIIPSFRTIDSHFAGGYYTTNFIENLRRVFSPATGSYLFNLFSPTLFTSLLSPIHLLIALPEFAINILSKNSNMRALQYHYTALLTPIIYVSSIYGVANLKKFTKKLLSVNVFTYIIGLLFLLNFVVFLIKSPVISSNYLINEKKSAIIADWQSQLKDEKIPVSATGHLSPYFSGRQYFYNFLFDYAYHVQGYSDEDIKELAHHYRLADYVLIQESEVTDNEMAEYYYYELRRDPLFEKVFDEEGIEVYKKQLIK